MRDSDLHRTLKNPGFQIIHIWIKREVYTYNWYLFSLKWGNKQPKILHNFAAFEKGAK